MPPTDLSGRGHNKTNWLTHTWIEVPRGSQISKSFKITNFGKADVNNKNICKPEIGQDTEFRGIGVSCQHVTPFLNVLYKTLKFGKNFILFIKKIHVCETLMSPLPNISRKGLTFDLDLSSTDLNIDRGHLLIKDYLPTKFEASGSKRSWVISCKRYMRQTWPLSLTFNLLTWISIGIIYSSWTVYLPNLKLLGQSILQL